VSKEVFLLIGTKKGAFILTSDDSRTRWVLRGPYHKGSDVFHMVYDARGEGAIFAAVNNPIWGAKIHISRDMGETWAASEEQPAMAADGENTLKNLWHIKPGRDNEPGVLYAGADPASLFKSEDGGATWYEVTSLSRHETRKDWHPGFGGLCLHSIVLDSSRIDRMWVGISAVGVFGTEDDGKTWQPMNRGVRADFLPDPFPEYGQCPHKVLSHQAKPNTLLQQNHCGVFRSDSGGEQWEDISEGLPSRFGFVLGLHSQDPDTFYVLPEDSAQGADVGGGARFVTDAKFRIYRTRNGGHKWESLTRAGFLQSG